MENHFIVRLTIIGHLGDKQSQGLAHRQTQVWSLRKSHAQYPSNRLE